MGNVQNKKFKQALFIPDDIIRENVIPFLDPKDYCLFIIKHKSYLLKDKETGEKKLEGNIFDKLVTLRAIDMPLYLAVLCYCLENKDGMRLPDRKLPYTFSLYTREIKKFETEKKNFGRDEPPCWEEKLPLIESKKKFWKTILKEWRENKKRLSLVEYLFIIFDADCTINGYVMNWMQREQALSDEEKNEALLKYGIFQDWSDRFDVLFNQYIMFDFKEENVEAKKENFLRQIRRIHVRVEILRNASDFSGKVKLTPKHLKLLLAENKEHASFVNAYYRREFERDFQKRLDRYAKDMNEVNPYLGEGFLRGLFTLVDNTEKLERIVF